MPLTDAAARNAKPKDKSYKLADSGGLYLEILPAGGKYWRMKYRANGKESRLAFGVYPTITLLQARKARDAAKDQLAQGLNPAHEKKRAKLAALVKQSNSFQVVAQEWLVSRQETWSESHAQKIKVQLEKDVFATLGARPIAEITAPELLSVIRQIESRDALETSRKVLQTCGQIFRYAIATGKAERDPSPDLRGALKTRTVQHMRRIGESELPNLLEKIDQYEGEPVTRLALRLLMLTFVRTMELRFAEWTELDLVRCEWRIPAEKMKMRAAHIVPLCKQAIAVLEELQALTGSRRWLFPNANTAQKPMSENTVLYALYRMGYHGRMTGHGFRGLASTILNEHGFNSDWIERQLAHVEQNGVRAAYNHAEYLTERRKMMQWWGDYLDKQR